MAAIFQDVVIGWKGEEYSIRPTMALLNRIEQRVSLSALAASLQDGAPKLTHVAEAVSVLLQSKGVPASSEDVYVEILHGDGSAIIAMAQAIVLAAFPGAPKGNADGPKTTAKTAKKSPEK